MLSHVSNEFVTPLFSSNRVVQRREENMLLGDDFKGDFFISWYTL